ncbi:carboxypeptidase-like regulatory domain-containing protein [Tuwongella immobilis]|uniref:Carboxypeptidase regulatory-like domain-containing protein n=1 Tax=Tuwongella immobilis TaxID=692036 RepID=A0A6C2YJX5_9BACT|nr:carboxypeptidase-like regulatory domain-containing protein [Tuwongella immobilis]VIP01674.1 unnamed protein product [Tuwongella immobilis]VTR99110.1 unnamed protein product [Tuwongella immobilis]
MRAIAFALVAGLMIGCSGGSTSNDDTAESINGKITFKGEPVKGVTLIVKSADGKDAGGSTNEVGEYTIPSPPKGKLGFMLIPAGGKAAFPAKYTKAGNDLSFDYQGGKQTFNIELKP